MDYSSLTFRELQEEARHLGIQPIEGKGIDRYYLIRRIEQIPSENILASENEDLYNFLLPIIDDIPRIRQEPAVFFEENSWNMILDELNGMKKKEYQILETLINGNQQDIFYLLSSSKEMLYDMYERYPVLTYGAIARRISEDPWIQVAIVLVGAANLYPHSDFIHTELHPFSRMYLSYGEKGVNESINLIEEIDYDENMLLEFWKILMQYINHTKAGPGDKKFYKIFELEKSSNVLLPVTEDILDIYDSIHTIYEKYNKEKGFLFSNIVTKSILSPKRKNTKDMIKFMNKPIFLHMVKKMVNLLKDQNNPNYHTHYRAEIIVNHLIDPILFIKDEFVIRKLGHILLESGLSSDEIYDISSYLGYKIAVFRWIIPLDRIIVYGHNFGVLSNIIDIQFMTFMEYISNNSPAKPHKQKIYAFFDALMKARTKNNEIILLALETYGDNLLSEKEMESLKENIS